jgi:hypothetical protein
VDEVGRIRDVIPNGSPQYIALPSFTDANNNVFKVSPQIKELMDRLVGLVATHPRFQALNAGIVVVQAYVAPDAGVTAATVTYHNEARAISYQLGGKDSSTATASDLAALARMAFYIGFGWTTMLTNNVVYSSVMSGNEACKQPVDLGFLLDASLSIEDPRPMYGSTGIPGNFEKKVLTFVTAITESFDVGQNTDETRIAVASFSGKNFDASKGETDKLPTLHFDFDDVSDTNKAVAAVNKIPYNYGMTHTSTAVAMVRNDMFVPAAGVRDAAEGVPRILIVVTDGKANQGYDPTAEAELLHDDNVEVYAIGVGNADIFELNGLASNPDVDHAFLVKSAAQLDSMVEKIVGSITTAACEAPAAMECGGAEVASTIGEGAIVYFEVLHADKEAKVTVNVLSGAVVAFGSATVATPGPFAHVVTAVGTVSTDAVLTVPGTGKIYVAVKGTSNDIASFKVSADCTKTDGMDDDDANNGNDDPNSNDDPNATPTTTPVGGWPTTATPVGGWTTTATPVGGWPTTATPVGGWPTTATPVGGFTTTKPDGGGGGGGGGDDNDGGDDDGNDDDVDDDSIKLLPSDDDDAKSYDDDDDGGGSLCDSSANDAAGVTLCHDADGVAPTNIKWKWKGGLNPVPEDSALGYIALTLPAPFTPDNPTEFRELTTTFQIKEGSFKKRLPKTAANDEGTRARRAVDPKKNAFAIDEKTGEVFVDGELDFESKPLYEFEVKIRATTNEVGLAANNFSGVILVSIDIEAVACLDGTWSATGTYPCADHTICPTGVNETLIEEPTLTSDRICPPATSLKKSNGKGGLIVGLIILFLFLLLLLILFCKKRERDEEEAKLADVESGPAPTAVTTTLKPGGLGGAAAAPPSYTAAGGGNPADNTYLTAVKQPALYETAANGNDNQPYDPVAAKQQALYETAGNGNAAAYDPFGAKKGQPAYGMAGGATTAETALYDTAGGGAGAQPAYGMAGQAAAPAGSSMYETAAGSASDGAKAQAQYDTGNAKVQAQYDTAAGASAAQPQAQYDTAGSALYDTAGAGQADAAAHSAGNMALYAMAAEGATSQPRPSVTSFTEGDRMYDTAGAQLAGDAIYDEATGGIDDVNSSMPMGSGERSRSYDTALNTVGTEQPTYVMAGNDGAAEAVYDAADNSGAAVGTLQPSSYMPANTGQATYDTAASSAGVYSAAVPADASPPPQQRVVQLQPATYDTAASSGTESPMYDTASTVGEAGRTESSTSTESFVESTFGGTAERALNSMKRENPLFKEAFNGNGTAIEEDA